MPFWKPVPVSVTLVPPPTSPLEGLTVVSVSAPAAGVYVNPLGSDAELPSFDHEEQDDGSMVLIYRSRRALADLAEGLLQGCIAHFNEPMQIKRNDLPSDDGAHTRFTLSRPPID